MAKPSTEVGPLGRIEVPSGAVWAVTSDEELAGVVADALPAHGLHLSWILHPEEIGQSVDVSPDVVLLDQRDGGDLEKRLQRLGQSVAIAPPVLALLGAPCEPPHLTGLESFLVDFEREPFHGGWLASRLSRLVALGRERAELVRQQLVFDWTRRAAGVLTWEYDPAQGLACSFPDLGGDPGDAAQPNADFARLILRIPAEEREELLARLAELNPGDPPVDVEHHVLAPSGASLLYAQRIARLAGPRASYVGVARDVTDARAAARDLEKLAHFDSLTGLLARHHFLERLDAALASGRPAALLGLNLDSFKRVNTYRGHGCGDLLLQQAAERLRRALRASALIPEVTQEMDRPVLGRMGGDEFMVLVPRIGSDDAARIAREVVVAFEEPFDLRGVAESVHPRIGIAVSPEHGQEAEALVRHADLAMCEARDAPEERISVFRGSVEHRITRRRTIEEKLRAALERSELAVHYQPRVALRTGRVVGAEALLRWTSPELGRVSPGEFIPIAEESGLIVPLGRWVMESACRDAARLTSQGMGSLSIAINVSGIQFEEDNLSSAFLGIIREAGVRPQQIEIEVTESIALRRRASVDAALREFRAVGIQVALDDFGTGFSSLSVLLDLPLDCLKLDMSIIREIHTNPDAASVARAIVVMAHSLGLRVVAEGVSEDAQLALLRQIDCDESQGFMISPAVPFDAFVALTREQRS